MTPGVLGAPFTSYLPYKDTRQTVGKMLELYRVSFEDPSVFGLGRSVAESICRRLDPKDYVSECVAVLRFCEDPSRLRYFRDPRRVELVQGPDVLLDRMSRNPPAQEDCESIALLIAFLVGCTGGDTRFVTCGFTRGADAPHTHAFTQAKAGSSWVTLDPVAGPRTAWMLKNIAVARVYTVT